MEAAAPGAARASSAVRLLGPLLLAASIGLGVYLWGHERTPDPTTSLFGDYGPDTISLKSWLATGVLAAAMVQLVLALGIYGRLPGTPRSALPIAHRLVGVAALAASIPIAYHCMLAYGVRTFDTRVAVHSVAGSFVYGAVAAKLLIVRTRRLPGWALPVAGGVLVSTVVVLWYTSAVWYFDDFHVPFP
jgi:Family of unknown function (DUF6529)